ncbi:putative phage protein (TIGR02218 family) [Sphingomonas sp. BE138]|uniref:DUF2163 domain-containing protein n=1 Tax=Sphingomonas sp. BE138 TaxID=2817845 RepID=UPI00285CD8E2|nr:DUF2163 domain-containing protein [Sphingomonas sp. BE138]MDR6788924.1 putative phage protein (TIGR02218 family) [Sphingomonas sp. BE138]
MSDRLLTQALCWRVERRDGVMVALTDHDRDLAVDGVSYRAAPGVTPSAVVRAEGLDADTMEVTGALGEGAFRRADLIAGRWDGARVAMLAVDWSDPARGVVPLGEGRIGAVELGADGFTAELRGVQAMLERPVSEATSAACRATLGDARCRVAMAGRRRFARVVAWEGERVTLDRTEPVADAYGEGVLRWFGGANAGLASAVERSDGAVLTLRAPPAFAVAAGTLVAVVEGCDRRLATCAGRFGNVANFRGEPHLPGIDLLTRYPGA